ncbi:MAG: Glu/Leu/Phe/Val dehydrogenase dimerization domain-containing protein [Nannocystaceae bacterium]
MRSLVDLSPRDFVDHLGALGLREAFATTDAEGTIRVSHPGVTDLGAFLRESSDYAAHEGVFLARGDETGALFGAFVHDTRRGLAQGGLRFWPYESVGDLLRDGLRLAQGMTRKNALAGLWWGGGKGIIARDPAADYRDPGYRRTLYREYGAFVTGLRGAYVTAEDVGTGPADMAEVFTTTRFVTCIPPAVGGAGNPSPATAQGVVCAMEGALDYLGLGTLEGKTIAMQGLGNVGSSMLDELLLRGIGKAIASDISQERLDELGRRYQGAPVELRLLPPGDASILAEPCDILAPNALGAILNPQTIPAIRARIVCGAANNQLLDAARDGEAIRARGLCYVPDFLANRMGIVRVANEQYGHLPDDPAIRRHLGREWENSVFAVTRKTLALADREGITTAAAAIRIADERARDGHPLWGHRGRHHRRLSGLRCRAAANERGGAGSPRRSLYGIVVGDAPPAPGRRVRPRARRL